MSALYALRFTLYALRFTLYALRFTLYALRFNVIQRNQNAMRFASSATYKKMIMTVVIVLSCSVPSTLIAQNSRSERFWVPGFTLGTRTGLEPRAGLDLSLMTKTNSGDGIAGYGAIAGISGLDPFEYYVGIAGGGAYMIAAWGEVTANFVGKDYKGLRVLAGLGLLIMPYLAVGYDKRVESGFYAETGLTIKLPVRM